MHRTFRGIETGGLAVALRPVSVLRRCPQFDLRDRLCTSKAAGRPAPGIGFDAPLRGVRCGARIEVVPHNSQRSLRRATLKQDAADQRTKHASTRADLDASFLAVSYSPRHWPARSLAATRSEGLVARVRTRTLRHLTRSIGSTTASAASGGRYAAGPRDRAPQCSRCTHRPPHRSARRQPSHGLAGARFRGGQAAYRDGRRSAISTPPAPTRSTAVPVDAAPGSRATPGPRSSSAHGLP